MRNRWLEFEEFLGVPKGMPFSINGDNKEIINPYHITKDGLVNWWGTPQNNLIPDIISGKLEIGGVLDFDDED